MATFDPSDRSGPRISPHLMVGVASPLWAYFGAAAAGGLAYWWMRQWTRPVNLEAMFGKASTAMPLAAPVEAAAEAVVDALEAAQDALAKAVPEPPVPVGGESAPISPILEVAPAPEPVVEPAPEPAIETATEAAIEAAAEPALQATKAAETAIEAASEAVEAAPEPVIEEPTPALTEQTPKLRGKKSAPPVVDGDA